MKEMVRYGLTLSVICAAASASLAAVNSATKPKIIEQAKAEEEASLRDVLPGGEKFEPVRSGEEVVYYKAFDNSGKMIGVAFKAQGKGYSSTIETMVGMTSDGNIQVIKILSQNETPGLGAQVSESKFTDRFSGKNTSDLNGVEAITGATISSRAVINSVAEKAKEIQELLKK
jgi:Na+-translocating ferredoxin:NAD+ oxidoreductase subunit G